MDALKAKIISLIRTKKVNVFFVFLLLSFVILVFTKLSKTYTRTQEFTLVPYNVPEKAVILNPNLKLQLTLKGQGFTWLSYLFSSPKLKVDFKKDVIKTKSAYIWTKDKGASHINTQLAKHVEVIAINQNEMVFKYDENASKKVPVIIASRIEYKLGYDAPLKPKIIPDSITIIGPNKALKTIQRVTTDSLILNNVSSPISKPLKLKLDGFSKAISFSKQNVLVKLSVEKFTEGTLMVPVIMVNVPDSIKIKYYPKEVNVLYYTSLKAFKTITKSSFKVECDFNSLRKSEGVLMPKLIEIPSDVKHAKVHERKIEFVILK